MEGDALLGVMYDPCMMAVSRVSSGGWLWVVPCASWVRLQRWALLRASGEHIFSPLSRWCRRLSSACKPASAVGVAESSSVLPAPAGLRVRCPDSQDLGRLCTESAPRPALSSQHFPSLSRGWSVPVLSPVLYTMEVRLPEGLRCGLLSDQGQGVGRGRTPAGPFLPGLLPPGPASSVTPCGLQNNHSCPEFLIVISGRADPTGALCP